MIFESAPSYFPVVSGTDPENIDSGVIVRGGVENSLAGVPVCPVSVRRGIAESVPLCSVDGGRVVISPSDVTVGKYSEAMAVSGLGVGAAVSVPRNRYLNGVTVRVGKLGAFCLGNQATTTRTPMPINERMPTSSGNSRE